MNEITNFIHGERVAAADGPYGSGAGAHHAAPVGFRFRFLHGWNRGGKRRAQHKGMGARQHIIAKAQPGQVEAAWLSRGSRSTSTSSSGTLAP